MIIGITGPSGSGKSTALWAFKRKGFELLDCDVIYHQLLAKDKNLQNDIRKTFPTVMAEDGILNRKALASIVFNNENELATLNAITYPYMESYLKSYINTSSKKKFVIEAINMIGYPLEKMCDRVIVVIASGLTRLRRIAERDNITLEQAEERLRAQEKDFAFDMSKYEVLRNNFDSEKEWFKYVLDYIQYL